MLYDILPPTVLFVSLSGIIVILSRGVVRGRRAQFAQSIKSADVATPAPSVNEVLRPTQKSVQAIKSRAALLSAWMANARGGLQAIRPRREQVEALREKARGRLRWRRNRHEEPQEPNLDTLFAREDAPEITTRVVTAPTAPVVPEAVAVPVSTPLTSRPELRQNHTPKKKKLTPLQRAQVALDSREYQHAEDILVDYIVQHTKDAKAYMLLGNVAMAKADWEECLEIFEQVMRLKPGEPGAQAGFGIAAYNLGRYAKALPALQRAHEEDPRNLTVLRDLLAIAKRMDNAALQRSIQTKLEALEEGVAAESLRQPT